MIKQVEFGDKDEIMANVQKLRRSLPALLQYQLILAKMDRARYDALIAEKFTEAQAIEIVKGMHK